MYILFCGTNQKSMLQKEIKDLTFEVSNHSTCLQFLLFLNNRSIFHFCEWGWVVCECHNCLISNKKVTFLAWVPVLKWNSRPRFLINVHSKWKVTWNIFNLQERHQNMHNCKSLFKEILPLGKIQEVGDDLSIAFWT